MDRRRLPLFRTGSAAFWPWPAAGFSLADARISPSAFVPMLFLLSAAVYIRLQRQSGHRRRSAAFQPQGQGPAPAYPRPDGHPAVAGQERQSGRFLCGTFRLKDQAHALRPFHSEHDAADSFFRVPVPKGIGFRLQNIRNRRFREDRAVRGCQHGIRLSLGPDIYRIQRRSVRFSRRVP